MNWIPAAVGIAILFGYGLGAANFQQPDFYRAATIASVGQTSVLSAQKGGTKYA